MGVMIEGRWHDHWYDTKASQGRFVRSEERVPQLGDPRRRAGS